MQVCGFESVFTFFVIGGVVQVYGSNLSLLLSLVAECKFVDSNLSFLLYWWHSARLWVRIFFHFFCHWWSSASLLVRIFHFLGIVQVSGFESFPFFVIGGVVQVCGSNLSLFCHCWRSASLWVRICFHFFSLMA